jgi:hypothetical protein
MYSTITILQYFRFENNHTITNLICSYPAMVIQKEVSILNASSQPSRDSDTNKRVIKRLLVFLILKKQN